MALTDVWFLLIAVLWTGYFVLEGFDFGVGILLRVLGRDDTDRRVLINTIGPLWDGNEVWLIVAGGATFAAFPEWYASLFSGFYLALLLILVALIGRGVAFEYRGKVETERWRTTWDRVITVCSVLPALLWGVAFANIVGGVPVDARHEFVGTLLSLLTPYGLLGGLTTLALFALHGAVFVSLKTDGDIRLRARALAGRIGYAAVPIAAVFLLWTWTQHAPDGTQGTVAAVLGLVAALALVGGLLATTLGREGWGFVLTAGTIAAAVAFLFTTLYPAVLPSSLDPAFDLTTTNAASTPYTLTIMTWVAGFMTPVVLAYQSWTYWVFRQRISRSHIPASTSGPAHEAPVEETA